MAERPILFSGPMVRAILDGKKTQTRRVLSPQPMTPVARFALVGTGGKSQAAWFGARDAIGNPVMAFAVGKHSVKDDARCPYGEPGSTLWVRERFSFRDHGPIGDPDLDTSECWYWADGNEPTHGNWSKPKPSIHMPRAASRLTLRIVSVRVERLRDISHDDAVAEGVQTVAIAVTHGGEVCGGGAVTAREQFAALWDSINAKRAPWSSNPWVWCIEFERVALSVSA